MMIDRLPEITKKGILLETADPQPVVRKNAEIASDWEYSEEACYLYSKAMLFKDRLLDPLHHLDRNRLPDPIIAFENLRNQNTLAAFRLTRNPQGLKNEIIMNKEHYVTQEGKMVWEYGRWAQLETLLHEQVHEWQQVFGKDPVKLGRIYHNKEFVSKCQSLGLHPLLGAGCHIKLADGVFGNLMKELGINPPDLSDKPDIMMDWFKWYLDTQGKARKGRSSLRRWTCPECGLHARFGIKSDPEIRHDPCEQKTGHAVFFVCEDGLPHTIYEADEQNSQPV